MYLVGNLRSNNSYEAIFSSQNEKNWKVSAKCLFGV